MSCEPGGCRLSASSPLAGRQNRLGRTLREQTRGGILVDEDVLLRFAPCRGDITIGEAGDDALVIVVSGITMAVDFGYRWRHWHDAKYVIDRIADCNIFFAEAPLQHDDLPGHAHLARMSPVRIAGAEFAATRWECRDWIETGEVAVIQPGITRAGGFAEMMRIAEFADQKGVQLVPLAWHTGITAAAALHFQAATINTPAVEYFPIYLFDSPLREHLVSPEAAIKDGKVKLPEGPGLGVTLNEEIIRKYGQRKGT